MSSEIDLRAEFNALLEARGHWGVLRRRIDERKAAGFNEQTHEAADRDNLSSGEAYVDIFVRLRKRTLFSTGEQPTPLGVQGTPLIIFYLQSTVKPTRGDWLMEIAQDESTVRCGVGIQPSKPFNVTRKYDIQDVDDMRDQSGRVEFFTVYTEVADLGDT